MARLLAAAWLIGTALSAGVQPPERVVANAFASIYALRDYTVFDWIAGRYNRGTLTLEGFVRTPQLKKAAENAARKVSGIDEVVNQLEVLPSHTLDDDVRIRAYVAIYGSSALESYGPTGSMTRAVAQSLTDAAHFGLDGTDIGRGPHAIHIIVSAGRVILRGEVRSTGDRQIAEAAVRTLSGVLRVSNELAVRSPIFF